jgi:hypothetical protein
LNPALNPRVGVSASRRHHRGQLMDHPEVRYRLGFLYKQFNADVWWFEGADMVRLLLPWLLCRGCTLLRVDRVPRADLLHVCCLLHFLSIALGA